MYSMKHPHLAFPRLVEKASWVFISLLLAGCGGGGGSPAPASVTATGTPGAEASVGERLFLETRFAQAFKVFVDNGGTINNPNAGDPVVNLSETTGPGVGLLGPFAGLSMNCRACHLVDEQKDTLGGGMRTYADFAPRSPIPVRADGKTHAPRNSPALVNSALARPGGVLFHLDAEFNSMEDLVAATFIGRNFGWLPGERAQAIIHIANVVRGDDGSDQLAQDTIPNLSYKILFTGANPAIPDELRLPPEFRAFVGSGTDQEVFNAVVKVVAAYVNQLQFSQQEDSGALIRSPFDVFLQINGLPQQPDNNESDLDYSRRLLSLVKARELAGTLQFVTSNPNRVDGQFQFHPTQQFVFGTTELAGLKIFLSEPPMPPLPLPAGGIGNCIACHAAPNFTDFKLHNTGIAQKEYDDIHAPSNTFAGLFIPPLAMRDANYNLYLPVTEVPAHHNALEPFRAIPIAGSPNLTDLGVWNVFANPDMMPGPQAKIRSILCDDLQPCPKTEAELLDRAIARFKTPGLRDLAHSAPYMHNGKFGTLENAVGFYIGMSNLARAGTLRNGADALRGIALQALPLQPADDIAPLVAFLKSLNEDYQ